MSRIAAPLICKEVHIFISEWVTDHVDRASREPNFHKLYIDFLEKCDSVHLYKEVVEATYENCKVILRSELLKSSVEARKLLKNLGGWLGKLTIGRNHVLRARHIDPKSLIIEAYEKGLMIGVIPFTSKILESCKSSIAYQPPNPWTMAILELLAEIHTMTNLKANIKFEIELLFKHLDVDMNHVTPASLIKDKVRIIEGNLDFSQGKTVIEVKPAVISSVNQVVLQPEAAGPSYQGGHRHIIYQGTGQPYLQLAVTLGFPDQLSHIQGLTVAQLSHGIPELATSFFVTQSFLLNTYFQSVLLAAFEKAIEELVSTIVKRTVFIAIQTTIELVLKEYVTEPDENVIHSGSYWMVVYLAGNLSYMTCKEPLRSLMSTQLKISLQCSSIASELHEHVMQRAINKKLELGCAAIEKAATEKGLILVKREITQQLSIRRKHREGTTQVNTSALPEEFDLKSGELYILQLEVYTDFVRFYPQNSTQRWFTDTEMASGYHPHNMKPSSVANDSGVHGQTSFQPSGSNCSTSNITELSLNTNAALDKYQDLSKKLDPIVATDAKEAEVQVKNHPVANSDDNDSSVAYINNKDAPDSSVASRNDKTAPDSSVASRNDEDAPDSSEPDHPGFHEQVYVLFDEWCRICDRYRVNDKACARYIKQLHENVLSKADDMPDHFFHLLLERAVSHCLSFERINSSPLQFKQEDDPACFLVIDRYTDLVFLILKFYPVDQRSSKLSLLSKVLDVIVNFIIKNANEKKTSLNARPYFRLFINFFTNDETNFKVLAAISDSFHSLQPTKVPEFSFAWLELVTHKEFMRKLLTESVQNRWRYFLRLVVDLLQFMEPKLATRELPEEGDLLHKGIFRLLYVMNFEYPDFLCYYHFDLCEVISPHCAQLRNIILSAVPCNKKRTSAYYQADPASEMKNPPRSLSNFVAALEANKLKNEVDEYLMTRPEESPFLSQLKYKLFLPSSEADRSGTCYNVPLMTSLVLYVGTKAIEQKHASTTPRATSKAKKKAKSVQTNMFYEVALDNAAFDIFQALLLNLDSEGRYIFFNAVANHLRYPNNQTNYFSILLHHFFEEINQQEIRQQMITVLLERLILNHAFPWGTLVTFLGIVKYHQDDIWNLPLKKPEMEKISYIFSKYLDKENPLKGTGSSDAVRRKNIL